MKNPEERTDVDLACDRALEGSCAEMLAKARVSADKIFNDPHVDAQPPGMSQEEAFLAANEIFNESRE